VSSNWLCKFGFHAPWDAGGFCVSNQKGSGFPFHKLPKTLSPEDEEVTLKAIMTQTGKHWLCCGSQLHLVLPRKAVCPADLFLVDGDPQQRAKLVKAIKMFAPHAEDGSCGWHLIHQGWKRHGPTNTCVRTKADCDQFDLFKTHACNQTCSWMTLGRSENPDEHGTPFFLLKEQTRA
jgi:hypothetical protein